METNFSGAKQTDPYPNHHHSKHLTIPQKCTGEKWLTLCCKWHRDGSLYWGGRKVWRGCGHAFCNNPGYHLVGNIKFIFEEMWRRLWMTWITLGLKGSGSTQSCLADWLQGRLLNSIQNRRVQKRDFWNFMHLNSIWRGYHSLRYFYPLNSWKKKHLSFHHILHNGHHCQCLWYLRERKSDYERVSLSN